MAENKIHNSIDLRKAGEKTPTITHIPTSWDDKDLGDFNYKYTPEKKISIFTKFFLFSLTIFLFSASFAIYSLYKNANSFSESNIDFVLTPPASISGGEVNNIPVLVTNRNSVPIISTYIILSYNAGENMSGGNNLTEKRIDLGDIVSNGSVNSSFPAIFYGNEGDIRKLSAKLFYSLAGNKAVYNKDIEPASLTIKSSPISITVNSFKEMIAGNNYDFDIFVKNNTSNSIKNLIVSVRPPNDFVYASSSMNLLNKNPAWLIKDLSANGQIKITMSGKVNGTIGENKNFSFYVGSNEDSINSVNGSSSENFTSETAMDKLKNNSVDNYNISITNIFSQVTIPILLTGQYLDIKLLNNVSGYEENISAGSNLYLEFNYKNNLNFPIDNVVFNVKLSGDAIDFYNTNAVNGIVDATSSAAFWNKNTMPELSQIPAKGSGKFILNIKASRLIANSGKIKVQVFASGERNAEYSVSNQQNMSLEKAWTVTK